MAITVKTQSGRTCIWCSEGSNPENPMTEEHVIAKWVAKAMEGDGKLNHAYRDPGAERDSRSWTASEPSFKVRRVCRRCNNEWMSDLETAAGKYLPPFIQGRRGVRVNYRNAPALARWAAKTGLMFQPVEARENRVVPDAHFHKLRLAKIETLPPEIRVWIGAVRAAGVWCTSFGGTLNLPPDGVSFYAVLLAVDRVAFMIMGAESATALAELRLGALENAWIPLWPLLRPQGWPPPYVWPADQFPAMPQLMETVIGQAVPGH